MIRLKGGIHCFLSITILLDLSQLVNGGKSAGHQKKTFFCKSPKLQVEYETLMIYICNIDQTAIFAGFSKVD